MLLILIYLIGIISVLMDIADSWTLEEIFHISLAKTEYAQGYITSLN